MRSIKNRFRNAKLRHKLMGIYLCIGTIPILILGIFAYYQQRTALMEKEQQNITDVLSQGVSRFHSQMLIYENLSDYIAFNSPISNVLLGEYGTIYEMYEQYRDYVDPVLSSVKYFSPDIMKFTIYVDRDITAHDTTVAPLREIEQEKWYQEEELNQNIQWKAQLDEKRVFCFRTMPIMEQSGSNGILYLEVNYQELFGGFDEIFKNDYGLCVYDEENCPVYRSVHFGADNKEFQLSEKELLAEYQKAKQKKSRDYTIVSSGMGVKGWKVLLYRPNQIVAEAGQDLIVIASGIIAACILISILASIVFSRLIVLDIEKLQRNMKSVEEGDLAIQVTSDAADEIGDLIRGFGSMIEKINHLINKVYEGKLLQKQYEMRALQAQINPHFLYNSLSLINWKALEAGKEDISKLTLALSSFYRTSLNRGSNVLTIEQELENMKSYLEIQLCMHDNSFDVVLDVDKGILPYQTLNLLLQPLVENAIEHGIDLLEDRKGIVKITGQMDQDKIYLCVADNGVGIEPELLSSILEFKTRGYGVRNVNERIKLFYGEEYQLQIESREGEGTKSIITIPREMPKAALHSSKDQ